MPDSQRSSGPSDQEPVRDGAPNPPELVLSGAWLADGRAVDVRLSGGRIEAVGTAGSLAAQSSQASRPSRPSRPSRKSGSAPPKPPAPSQQSQQSDGAQPSKLDLTGYLLLPAPAEPHAHLDTALTAGSSGPPPTSTEDVQRRVTEAALLQLGYGATAVRTHVRIGDVQGLRILEAVLQARQALRGLVEVSAVAVPRVLTGAAGADGLAMLRDALKMGASVVGGCPDLDPDPTGYVEAVLQVAAEFGCPVDLHSDAADPVRLGRLAAMAGGLRPGVTLGPCGALGRLPQEALARAAAQLAAAGVAVVCLPQGGCGTLERRVCGPMAPVRALRTAGVRVAAGSGALRDLSNPVGRADPLESAYLLTSWGQAGAPTAYEAISGQARAVIGLPEVRVEAGFPAELLAVRGNAIAGALSVAYSRVVVHRGRVVSRTSAVREYTDTASLDLPRQSRTDDSA